MKKLRHIFNIYTNKYLIYISILKHSISSKTSNRITIYKTNGEGSLFTCSKRNRLIHFPSYYKEEGKLCLKLYL